MLKQMISCIKMSKDVSQQITRAVQHQTDDGHHADVQDNVHQEYEEGGGSCSTAATSPCPSETIKTNFHLSF